jgi:phospholipase C
MAQGDNWIGQVVSAIENGPDWGSTAIFITYDDCGCFYDHVAPPAGLGIRVPMVIASPYAKPRFVDSHKASFASLLAFTEHTFGLPSLGGKDSSAYDYSDAFNYSQTPNPPTAMTQTRLSAQERHRLRTIPHPEEGT